MLFLLKVIKSINAFLRVVCEDSLLKTFEIFSASIATEASDKFTEQLLPKGEIRIAEDKNGYGNG